MSYFNYTNDAIYELERQRTHNFGADYESQPVAPICEECGNDNKIIFKINSHYICEDCVCNLLRDAFDELAPTSSPISLNAEMILKNIIEDFSDSELLSYVEDVYEKI